MRFARSWTMHRLPIAHTDAPVRQTLHAVRESFLHLSQNPGCQHRIAQAVNAAEQLGEDAARHDRRAIRGLAERMASTLRSAALQSRGIGSNDLTAVHRLLSDAIASEASHS